jgi:multiple sugar transport system permease protein
MPNVISAVALATMWLQYVFNNRFGLMHKLSQALGQTTAIEWTGPEFKFTAMLIAYCFGMVGYHMLIFSSGIEKIPADFFEASHIDGAGRVRQFFAITLPLLKGVTRTNITMWSVTSVGFFVWSQLFSTVTADTTTITPYVYMYLQTFGSGNTVTERNAGLGAAVGLVLSILVVMVFVITTKLLKDDNLEF